MKIWKNLFGNGDKIDASNIAVSSGTSLSSVVIVESGSNENGHYIKWGDGTMICTREVTIDLNDDLPQSFNFPAVYTRVDFVGKQYNDGTVTAALTSRYNDAIVYVSGSNWVLRTRSPESSPPNLTLKLFAIGRWK